jgi:DNA-binding NarL/FixJ family response regulator
MTIRAVIADRNRLVREVVTRALRAHEIAVVADVSGADELSAVVVRERPDVVVLSDPLGGRPIDELITRSVDAGAHVVVLSDTPAEDRIVACLQNGATGYLTHDVKPAVIADAVISVCQGGAALHGRAARVVLAQWRGFQSSGAARNNVSLTPREMDVLTALVEGLPAKAIARRLGVALKTVESHKIRLFDKLGARNQAHAVSIAVGHGLVDPTPAAVSSG